MTLRGSSEMLSILSPSLGSWNKELFQLLAPRNDAFSFWGFISRHCYWNSKLNAISGRKVTNVIAATFQTQYCRLRVSRAPDSHELRCGYAKEDTLTSSRDTFNATHSILKPDWVKYAKSV